MHTSSLSVVAQVEKAEQDKKSAVIRAEGEAKSAQLLGEAIQHNPSFLNLRKIEARNNHIMINHANPPEFAYTSANSNATVH